MKHIKIKTYRNWRIIKILLITTVVSILLLLNFYLFQKFKNCSNLKICYKNFCWKVKLSKTKKEREKWLMFVKKLSINEWMLFVFPLEGQYSFWMKNTYIPLDIIWLDKNFKIIKKRENASPCISTISNCHIETNKIPSKYVLEIKWWLAKKLNINTWEYFYILWKKSCLDQ